jgi:hypothetical protein
MDHLSNHSPHHLRVTALFGDHEESFDLANGTTLEQVAERLAQLAQQNHGWPVGISVLFDAEPEPSSKAQFSALQGRAPSGQLR